MARSLVRLTEARRLPGIALICASLLACGVDTADIAFLPDDEFHSTFGGSAGSVGVGAAGGGGGAPAGGPGTQACGPDEEGVARCAGGDLSICKGGVYRVVESCASQERCSARRKTCLDCTPGTFRCVDDRLEQCNLEGSAYELVRACEEGRCEADEHRGFCQICEPGAVSCEAREREFPTDVTGVADLKRTRERLRGCNEDGSGTATLEVCDFARPVCDVEQRRCLVCRPGEIRCAGSELVRCDGEGMAQILLDDCGHPSLCDAQRGRCAASACADELAASGKEGPVACRGTTGTELSLCTSWGQWDILDLCDSAEACEAGTSQRRCLDVALDHCVPGALRCEDDTLMRCADFAAPDSPAPAGGSWYAHATCSGGCVPTGTNIAECSDAGGARPYVDASVCTPGESTYLDCSGSSCEEAECGSGEICAGSEFGCRSCVPNSWRCQGNALLRCDPEGGREEMISDCGDGVCDRFRQTCLRAPAGDRYCEGRELKRILDGATQNIERCDSAELCSPEGCGKAPCVVESLGCGEEQGRQVLRCVDGLSWRASRTRCSSADRCEDGLGCVAAVRVAAGEAHTCVLVVADNAAHDALGLVKCWGANESGQLGNGSSLLSDEAEARAVVFRERDEAVFTAAPRFRSSGLCAGKNFTCADAELPAGPVVVCWGSNEQGQLGVGAAPGPSGARPSNAVTLPVTKGVDVAPRDGVPDPFVGLGRVTCGQDFACGLDADGRAWCWGANDLGQLGTGQITPSPAASAQAVSGGSGDGAPRTFQNVQAGARHVCGSDEDGALWCWGGGARGQLGQASAGPSAVPVRLDTAVRTFAVGRDFTIWQADVRRGVLSVGGNLFGQLATGTNVATSSPVVASALDASDMRLLVGGPSAVHACAFGADALSCWGANPLGQLGDGTTEDRYAPVAIADAIELSAEPGSVALGRSHTCAVDTSGSLWCWGGNQRRQLGASVSGPFSLEPDEVLTGVW